MRFYLTAEKILNRYDISQTTLWRWQNDRELEFPPALKIGRRRLWRSNDLDKFDSSRITDPGTRITD